MLGRKRRVYVLSLLMLLSSWSSMKDQLGRTLFKARHFPGSWFWFEGEV